jgi:hypothetical protein
MTASAGQSRSSHTCPCQAGNTINDALIPTRPRPVTENSEYTTFARRVPWAFSRRVPAGDVESLAHMIALAKDIDDAIALAVSGLQDAGYSWAEIASRLGITAGQPSSDGVARVAPRPRPAKATSVRRAEPRVRVTCPPDIKIRKMPGAALATDATCFRGHPVHRHKVASSLGQPPNPFAQIQEPSVGHVAFRTGILRYRTYEYLLDQ